MNVSKSTVLYAGLMEEEINVFKALLLFNSVELSVGFNYLGFFLKTGLQKAEDWSWLLAKLEKRIGHWCNRWLSLGGRYILLKSVLESQLVYWMSLAAIPISVLNKIRKAMFSFLWKGSSENFHYHLCNGRP